jgi:hypothetical protein
LESVDAFDFRRVHGIVMWDELVKMSMQTPEWLLEELIPEQSITLLLADWGSGKTPWQCQLLFHLALGEGRPFLGVYRTPLDPHQTLLLDYESSVNVMKNLGEQTAKLLRVETVPPNFHFRGANYLPGSATNWTSNMAQFLEAIRKGGYKMIAADPIRQLDPDFESKNSIASRNIVEIRKAMSDSPCKTSVVLSHHLNKLSDDAPPLDLVTDPDRFFRHGCGAGALMTGLWKIAFELYSPYPRLLFTFSPLC